MTGLLAIQHQRKEKGRGQGPPEASTAAPSLSPLFLQNKVVPARQRRFAWPQLNVDGPKGGVYDDLPLGRGLQVVDVGHGTV